jgi:hypothetical protein
MAICGCGLPACCCQPAVAGGVIYADLGGELSSHLAPQALFTQSSPVQEPLLQVFPFPSTLGKVTLHPLSQACVIIYSSRGKWVFPPLLWNFPATTAFTSFPLLVAGVCRHSCLLQPACLFTVLWGIPLPSSSELRVSHPLCNVSLLFLLLITQFLFFPRWGSVCPGVCWSGPGLSVGVPRYREAHFVCVFPSHLGAGVWWPGGPPGFSVQREVEMLCTGWRCGGVKVLQWPCLQGVSAASLQDFTLGGTLSASSL